MSLGQQIRKYRELAGWTLEQLSTRANVDIGTISALEQRDSLRSQYSGNLARAFGLTIEQLCDVESTYPLAQDPLKTTSVTQGWPNHAGDSIAGRVKWARNQKRITQAQLAMVAGVAQGTIGNLESGFRDRPRELLNIANALGVHPAWIESGKGPIWQSSRHDWPFSVPYASYLALPEREKGRIDGFLSALVAHCQNNDGAEPAPLRQRERGN